MAQHYLDLMKQARDLSLRTGLRWNLKTHVGRVRGLLAKADGVAKGAHQKHFVLSALAEINKPVPDLKTVADYCDRVIPSSREKKPKPQAVAVSGSQAAASSTAATPKPVKISPKAQPVRTVKLSLGALAKKAIADQAQTLENVKIEMLEKLENEWPNIEREIRSRITDCRFSFAVPAPGWMFAYEAGLKKLICERLTTKLKVRGLTKATVLYYECQLHFNLNCE